MATRSHTIAIVGAGFSGTAVAYRLLRAAPSTPLRIVLIERAKRFGCGLAYSDRAAGTTLNVPASRMSLDENRPDDLLDYLRGRAIPVAPEEFVPRTLYGDYLEARLHETARAAPRRIRLDRINRAVTSISRGSIESFLNVELDDGSTVLADTVILATGHSPPRPLACFDALAGQGIYENDPWSTTSTRERAARVLLIGTGLTMADVACRLSRSAHPPREIVAISRRGLLPRTRCEQAPVAPPEPLDLEGLERATSLRVMLAETRRIFRRAKDSGIDWRDVMVVLRERLPSLWRKLSQAEKARFVRHLQPYWDVHRHQHPPLVARTLDELISDKRLSVRAGRITDASFVNGRAVVSIRPRHGSEIETQAFDRVINCSGPDSDCRNTDSPFLRALLTQGHAIACPNGLGLRIDRQGRVLGRAGGPTPGLYYVGPWLRSRDFEATAAQELRTNATELVQWLLARLQATTTFDYRPTHAHRSSVRPSAM